MVRFVLVLIVGLAVTACASFTVNPSTGDVSYTRIGGQEISGLEILKDGDKVKVKIETLRTEEANASLDAAIELLESARP